MLSDTALSLVEPWRANGLAAIGRAYPAHPAIFEHDLASHPLFDSSALVDAALTLPAASVELRGADVAQHFVPIPVTTDALYAMFAGSSATGAWLMIRGLETIVAYRTFIDSILAPVAALALPKTGKLHQPRAFLFCASAGALTPHHFDPEHNILFHLNGPKRFHVHPAKLPYLTALDHFRLHEKGENLLADPSQDGALMYDLRPGEALHVPYKWPHWVEVGNAPSMSLSITWTSDWSLGRDAAWRGESLLRRWHLPEREMPEWPDVTPIRSAIGRVVGRFG